MPDFSFPNWMLQQNTFADSLLKGVQAGSAIANTRYRNQALAAQAIDTERNYALREKSLQIDQEQRDIMMKSRLLEMETNKQMFADQVADKEALSGWIAERNKLSPEERLNMPIPNLRLPASFNAANQIYDNDRMSYQQGLAGKVQTALALRLGKIDADYVQQYINEPDPERKREILATGETAAAAKAEALKAVAPTIAAESRERLAKFRADTQEKLVGLRGDINLMRDQLRSEAALDLEGERQLGRLDLLDRRYERLAGLQEDSQAFKTEFAKLQSELGVVRDSLKPSTGGAARFDMPYSRQLVMQSELKEVDQLVKDSTIDSAEAAKRRAAIEAKYLAKPTPTTTPPDPSAKAALANKLASEHPDWDRARIISEVNKRLP